MIYNVVITLFACIVSAEFDAYRIKKNRKVNHAMNLFMSLGLVGFMCLVQGVAKSLPMLFLIPLVFDNYLNVRRFGWEGITYQPENPESKVDQIENRIFGHEHAWVGSNSAYLLIFSIGIILNSLL